MSEKCCCLICKKEFSIKGIHTHFERAHGTEKDKEKYSSGYNYKYTDTKYLRTLKEGIAKRFDKKLGIIKDFKVNCNSCNTSFTVKEREHLFPSKQKYFCSRSCANKRSLSKQQREKISKKLKKYIDVVKKCSHCETSFTTKKKNKKYCSVNCSNIHRGLEKRKQRSLYQNYRADCSFKFNLKDFPNEFNFLLIETYGWYKPKNRGNNLTGVSRDHIISVNYGFKNNIDPAIISHPANCQLMRHSENVSKYTKNDLSLKELLEKIEKWNKKYI